MALPFAHRCKFACHCLERARDDSSYYRLIQHDDFLRGESYRSSQQPPYLDDMSILRDRARGQPRGDGCFKPVTQHDNDDFNSPFEVLNLAFEIRRLVLRELLTSPSDINFCFIRLQGRLKLPSAESCRIWPQILRTSTQMCDEGRPILYHENTFGLTHTLALTSTYKHYERIHITKHGYECDGAQFWKNIRQLHITIRTTTRNGQLGQRSILNNVHRIVECVLDDDAPLRSLRISVISDEDPFHPLSGAEASLSSKELFCMLKPLTLLRVDGIVGVGSNDTIVSKRLRKAITDIEHPAANIYHLRDSIHAKIKEWGANDKYRRPDLTCVYDCDVEKVKRIYANMMATNKPWGLKQSVGLGEQVRVDEEEADARC